MNASQLPTNGLTARLPALPEEVEAWISTYGAVEDDERKPATLRRIGARGAWVRAKQIPRGCDDPGELVLDAVSGYVADHGRAGFQLVSDGYEPIDWVSEPSGADELPEMDGEMVPASSLRIAYTLLFQCTDRMITSVSAAPRLIGEIGGLMSKMIENAGTGAQAEGAAMAKAAGADLKHGRIIEVIKMLGGDPIAALTGNKPGDQAQVQGLVTQILGAVSKDERHSIMAQGDLLDGLYAATDFDGLEKTLVSLWALVKEDKVTLSADTKTKLRGIIARNNAKT